MLDDKFLRNDSVKEEQRKRFLFIINQIDDNENKNEYKQHKFILVEETGPF